MFPLIPKSRVLKSQVEIASEVPAKARVCDMVLEDKSRRRLAEHGVRNGHRRSQKYRSRKVRNITEAQEQGKPKIEAKEEAELIHVREKRTSEAAELLFKALGADRVTLLVKAFSEEEWPWDLLSALRRRLRVARLAKMEPDDAAH